MISKISFLQLFLVVAILFSTACLRTESQEFFQSNHLKNEIVFVYMGSTRCSICLDGPNKDFFKSINNNISSAAIESNFSVKRIGISVGSELNEGFNFLSQFDVNFDEIIVSPDNFNTGMIKYLYNDFKGEPTVPQFIILKRTYNQDISGIETVNRSIEDEKLLYRLVGLPNIEKFSKNSELINYSNFFD